MEAKTNIRRLLAGSSFVALLTASNAVLGAPLTNPQGNTTAFLSVTAGQTFDGVNNLGIIQNSTGQPGIEVEGGTVLGSVVNNGIGANEGLIDVSSTSTGVSVAGILINGTVGSTAVVTGAVANLSGTISAQGVNNAFGIGIGLNGWGVSIGGGVLNTGAIDVEANEDASASAFDFAISAAAQTSIGADASAVGIAVATGLPGGGIDNSGTIGVRALATAAARATALGTNVADADATATADAFAAGVIVSGATIAGDITNSGSITANATGSALSVANATALDGSADASATGNAQATAFGILIQSSTVLGNVDNSGSIAGNATAKSINTATAVADSGTAHASASGTAYATAYGLSSFYLISGNVDNGGTIGAVAQALLSNHATATGTSANAHAEAGSDFAFAYAYATGVDATVGQDFTNDGTVSAVAMASIVNNAVANSPSGAATASAGYDFIYAYASARGVDASIGGSFFNDGSISADATALIDNDALATGSSDISAVAGYNHNYAYSFATGVNATVDGDFSVSSSGSIAGNAAASILNHAQATAASGTADAWAGYNQNYAAAYARGVDAWVGGTFSNDGLIAADASAKIDNSAAAISGDYAMAYAGYRDMYANAYATGADLTVVDGLAVGSSGTIRADAAASILNHAQATATSGYAQAYAGYRSNYAVAYAVGLDASVGGGVSNNGLIAADAAAKIDNEAIASGGDYAQAYAGYHGNYAFSYAFGADLTVVGNILNDGTIAATAQATVANMASANAVSGYATAYAGYSDSYAFAYAVGALASLGGNLTNNGLISAEANALVSNVAMATGTNGAEARSGQDNSRAVAEAMGAIVVGSTIAGAISNAGTIDVMAAASGFATAEAHGFGGIAAADAEVDTVIARATGLQVNTTSLEGSVTNALGGVIEVNATALARAEARADGSAAALASASGSADAYGMGLDVNAGTIVGSVSNEGSISVTAVAAALNGDVLSDILGGTSLGGFGVTGIVTGIDTGLFAGTAGAFATGTSLARAVADGDADAGAVGFAVGASTIIGDVGNNGDIDVVAAAITTNAAHAIVLESGLAQASAFGRSANADATGLSISASVIDSTVSNSGSVINVAALAGSINVADALGSGMMTGTSLANVDASALARGSAFANAKGIDVYSTSLNGGFVNTGEVNVIAGAASLNMAEALTEYGDAYARASDTNDAFARATGIEVSFSTAGDDIVNSGAVSVTAVAISLNSATAAGTSLGAANYASAYVTGGAEARGRGLEWSGSTLTGNLSNDGVVEARAFALASDAGSAEGEYAYAYVYNYDANAYATGIYVSVNTLNGNFLNGGQVMASALAVAENSASAWGFSSAEAGVAGFASAYAIGVDFNADTVSGSVTNNAAIDVWASAFGSVTALAHGSAYARAYVEEAYVRAYGTGLRVDSLTISGDIANTTAGNIAVHVSATQLAQTTASAVQSAHGDAQGDAYANAYGMVVGNDQSPSVGGSFTNDGDLDVAAFAVASVVGVATATSSGGNARAEASVGNATVDAIGIDANLQTLQGDFYNTGAITVEATAVATSLASAAAHGTATASAEGTARARATGIELDIGYAGGNFQNDGTIWVAALAQADNRALAVADSSFGYAYAYAADDDDSSEARAEATGIDAGFSTLIGDFDNNGDVHVNATATNHTAATATGFSAAYGTAYGYAYAYAHGVEVGGNVLGSLGGHIANNALIDAVARANSTAMVAADSGYAFAYAYAAATGMRVSADFINGEVTNGAAIMIMSATAPATISAHAFATAQADGDVSSTAEAYARALGVSVFGYYTLGGGFRNSGNIVAEAQANATGIDSADAYATATGVSIAAGTSGIGGDIVNDGLIRAVASANASAIDEAHGYAQAYGLIVDVFNGGGIAGAIYNSGTIQATAIVHATPVGSGVGTAMATAMFVHVSGTVTGVSTGLGNSGLIEANAIDPLAAFARGLVVDDGYYAGDLNNSGTISAFATATASGLARATALTLQNGASFGGTLLNSGTIVAGASGATAEATAVKVTGGSYFSGGILNTGVIAATATGISMSTVAINLDGAGAGQRIQQVGGVVVLETGLMPGIFGDITMLNGFSDTIDWSGGLIEGDIYGDGNDTLNVFAGVDSEFDFADDIQGLYEINVNTSAGASAPVTLTVSGNIGTNTIDFNQIQNVNVNENGTLIVQPTALIETANLNVAGADSPEGTIQFNIKPTIPQNGVITAGMVTIGAGANSIAHALPGLFAAENDFLVIASTDITGEFDFSEDFTDLYTVTDDYQADGYHIVATRLAFGDIPGLNDDGQSAGEAIDNILDYLNENDPEGDLALALGEILIGTPEEYAENLNELAGSQNGDLLQAALQHPDQLIQIIFGQLGGGGGGGGAVADLGALLRVAANTPGDVMSDVGPQYASLANPSPIRSQVAIWARGFGNWTSLDRSAGSSGFTSNGGGVIVGGDYSFTDDFKLGLAGGYQKEDIDFRSAGDADIESWSITGYGRYETGAIYVDAAISYSWQNYDINRDFTVMGTPFRAHRSPDGNAFAIGGEFGYGFDLGDKAKLEPFAGVLYARTKVDSSTETGAAPFNLALDDEAINTTTTRLGARLSKTFGSEGGTQWTPELALGWKHQFGDENPSTTASFAGIPGSAFTVQGADASRDSAIVGAGVTVDFTETVDATVQYNGDFSSNYTDNTASLRLRLKF